MKSYLVVNNEAELVQQAILLHQNGQWQDAARAYKKLMKLFPKNPQLLAGYGMLELQQGNFNEAEKLFRKSLTINPHQAQTYCNLGTVLAQLKQYQQSISNFDKALKLSPNFPLAHFNRGLVFLNQLQYQEAIASFDAAIHFSNSYADAYFKRGLAYDHLDQYEQAIENYLQAIYFKADYPEAHNNIALIYHNRKQYQESLDHYSRAIQLQPDYVEAYNNRGNVYQVMELYDQALRDYEQAQSLNPNCVDTYNNLSCLFIEQKKYDTALANINIVISNDPSNYSVYSNRGNIYQEIGQFDRALEDYQQAITLYPNAANAYIGLGNLYRAQKQYQQALESFNHVLSLFPENPLAHFNIATLKLQFGDFQTGWELFEWRWKSVLVKYYRDYPQPLWLGQIPLENKTLFIHFEQGFGDTLQFCRYIPLLTKMGCRIVFQAQTSLLSLLSSLDASVELIGKDETIPEFDLHIPLLSLPLAFGTTISTIPSQTPYLKADSAKKYSWLQDFSQHPLKIGLVWSGSVTHVNDHHRSIPLENLKNLLSLPFEFHCLQKEIKASDQEILYHFPQLHIHTQQLHDFSDTAALLDCLDLIISVDTSIAHLAGALGKPVWILLPFYNLDFRWLIDRSDSPWYKTATLFRQTKMGDWDSVISQLSSRLLDNYA